MILKVEPQRIGKSNLEKRGGTGSASKLNPGPRTTHSPKAKVQGVCW
jgi:hypothetical protein